MSTHCILHTPSGDGENTHSQLKARCSPWKTLRNPESPGGTVNLGDLGTYKEISPFYLAASGAEKWQGGSLEPQTSALAEPEVVSTTQHFILASLACFHQNHVAKIMCDILKGKEFKPPCLTAPSISFVLLLLMLLSRPHTWCSAEQMLWKGGSARRSRVRLAAWVLSQ